MPSTTKMTALLILLSVLFIATFSFGWYVGTNSEDHRDDADVLKNNEQARSSDTLLFVPEGYRRLEDYTIVLDVAILAGTLDAVWVEYGKEAESLSQSTPPQSNELGMGTAGEYGLYSIIVPADSLEPGISYFYRVVGETTDGEMLRSGLSRFTAGK